MDNPLNDAHNHHCHVHNLDIDARMQEAQMLCQTHGGRFTALRQDIYRLILQAGKPLGAYDLINALQQKRNNETQPKQKNHNIAPPTIYRSLDFLLSFGLIHQLNSLNAYVPCCHPRQTHMAAFLICQICQNVQELSTLPIDELINYSQQKAHFLVKKSMIELTGICHDCRA